MIPDTMEPAILNAFCTLNFGVLKHAMGHLALA
jgi:hypothetical protein